MAKQSKRPAGNDASEQREDDIAPLLTPPALPDVDSPPPNEVLDGVPTPGEIVEQAQSAEEIVREQPDVDELLGRRQKREG